jgi:hypothetical protein
VCVCVRVRVCVHVCVCVFVCCARVLYCVSMSEWAYEYVRAVHGTRNRNATPQLLLV